MSKTRSNIKSLGLISLGLILAFIINYFRGWLSAFSSFQILMIALSLGLIEIFAVHKLTNSIPEYYRLDDDGAFSFISMGITAAILILK
jgi:hypothetical protein